jgi:hypothetical protein
MIRSTIVSFCHEAVLLDVVEVEAGKEVPLTNVSFSFPMVYRRKFSALVKNLVEKEEMFHFEYSLNERSFEKSIESFLEHSWKQIFQDSLEELHTVNPVLLKQLDAKFISERSGVQILVGRTLDGINAVNFAIHLWELPENGGPPSVVSGKYVELFIVARFDSGAKAIIDWTIEIPDAMPLSQQIANHISVRTTDPVSACIRKYVEGIRFEWFCRRDFFVEISRHFLVTLRWDTIDQSYRTFLLCPAHGGPVVVTVEAPFHMEGSSIKINLLPSSSETNTDRVVFFLPLRSELPLKRMARLLVEWIECAIGKIDRLKNQAGSGD